MSQPFIGSRISLISKSDIRYEGILYTIDTKESTVALAKVRVFGTEDRRPQAPVPPSSEVYEYIIFRGADIKDLHVCETPPNDPAIVGIATRPPPTSPASQASVPAPAPAPAPAAAPAVQPIARAPAGVSAGPQAAAEAPGPVSPQTLERRQLAISRPSATSELTQQQRVISPPAAQSPSSSSSPPRATSPQAPAAAVEPPRVAAQLRAGEAEATAHAAAAWAREQQREGQPQGQGQREGRYGQRRGGQGAGRSTAFSGPAVTKEQLEEYDFAEANAKFDKSKVREEAPEMMPQAKAYDRKASFFDTITSESAQGRARRVDMETFGQRGKQGGGQQRGYGGHYAQYYQQQRQQQGRPLNYRRPGDAESTGIPQPQPQPQQQQAQAQAQQPAASSRPQAPVPPSSEVYEYIIFRGADIKDLHVCETPPNDPAIVGIATRPPPTSPASQASVPAPAPAPAPAAAPAVQPIARAPAGVSAGPQAAAEAPGPVSPQTLERRQLAISRPSATSELTQQQRVISPPAAQSPSSSSSPPRATSPQAPAAAVEPPRVAAQLRAGEAEATAHAAAAWAREQQREGQPQGQGQREGRYGQRRGGQGAGRSTAFSGPAVTKEQLEEYDFAEANAKFDKSKVREEAPEMMPQAKAYDRKASFFDTITSESAQGRARRVDMETFGQRGKQGGGQQRGYGGHYAQYYQQQRQQQGRPLNYRRPGDAESTGIPQPQPQPQQQQAQAQAQQPAASS
eukprot:m51a1_g6264 hypothetical protein (740) ;mRNA; f:131360-134140